MRIFILLALAMSVFGMPEELTIDRFEEHGDLLPTFLNTKINPRFFRSLRNYEFDFDHEYSFTVDLEAIKKRDLPTDQRNIKLRLVFLNPDDPNITLVITAQKKNGQFRKHVARISPYEELSIQASKLMQFDQLHVTSFGRFLAHIEFSKGGDVHYSRELEVREPRARDDDAVIQGKTQNYHSMNYDQEYHKKKLRVEHFSGPFEDAYFDRIRDFGGGGQCLWTHAFELNVYWPDTSTLLHDFQGLNQGTGCNPNCLSDCTPDYQIMQYHTISLNDGTRFFWLHAFNYDPFKPTPTPTNPERMFDNVFFWNECGVVTCHDLQVTGRCASSSSEDWKWFVYVPTSGACDSQRSQLHGI